MDEDEKAMRIRQIEAMVTMATAADQLRESVRELCGAIATLTGMVVRLETRGSQLDAE